MYLYTLRWQENSLESFWKKIVLNYRFFYSVINGTEMGKSPVQDEGRGSLSLWFYCCLFLDFIRQALLVLLVLMAVSDVPGTVQVRHSNLIF